VTKNATILK